MQTSYRTALRRSLAHNPHRWRTGPIATNFFARLQQFRTLRSSFGYLCFNVLHALILRFSSQIHQRTRTRASWRFNRHWNHLNYRPRAVCFGRCCLRRTTKNWHWSCSRRYVPASSHPQSSNYNAMKEQIGAVESVKAASDIVCSRPWMPSWINFNIMRSMLPSLER